MAIRFYNNASTTIAGSITAIDTTVALAPGSGILFSTPTPPTAPDYFVATFYDQATKTVNEIVHVTAISGDVATIVRGQEGTTPKAWTAGDIFANLITAGTLEAFVQSTGPAADTSIVYIGTDTSTTPGIIIANTTPVPANFAIGMLFNIKVNNTNDGRTNSHTSVKGAVTLELNGKPYVVAKLSDGSDFIGAELASQHEYIFVYDGTTFSTQLVNAPRNPPQTVFYVRSDALSTVDMGTGLETATGFANTPADAFKTLQGAVNTITHRYISQKSLTLRVADGTYTSGVSLTTQYIAGWSIIGNAANPANCLIDCRSSNQSTFVPGSGPGSCCGAAAGLHVIWQGFNCMGYDYACGASGGAFLEIWDCLLHAPAGGRVPGSIGAGANGSIGIYGNCSYYSDGLNNCFAYASNGAIVWGWIDNTYPQATKHCNFTIVGQPVCTNNGFALSQYNGVIEAINVTWSGGPVQGPPYSVGFGGGFAYGVGQTAIPATANGVVDSSTGGWIKG
jgi:hypothetical protein